MQAQNPEDPTPYALCFVAGSRLSLRQTEEMIVDCVMLMKILLKR